MIDVVSCVEVNALGFFLDSHDGEAHVNAAVELPFLNLKHTRTHTLMGNYSMQKDIIPCS